MHGSGTIVLKQNHRSTSPVTLTGVWYAPEAAHCLLLVTALTHQGFQCEITDRTKIWDNQGCLVIQLLLCYQALHFTGCGYFWSLQKVKSTPCRITDYMICGIITLDIVPRMCIGMLMPNSKVYLLWLLLTPLLHVEVVNWVKLMSGNSLLHLKELQMSLTLFILIYVKCRPYHVLTINGLSPS